MNPKRGEPHGYVQSQVIMKMKSNIKNKMKFKSISLTCINSPCMTTNL